MSTTTKTRRPRKAQPRAFQAHFRFDGDVYAVKPLAGVHPEVAVKAYQLAKQTGDFEVYHVRLTPAGHAECDCKGHERWQHCKHVSMLAAFGCLPESCQAKPATPTASQTRPPVPASMPCSVCRGDGSDPFDPSARCIECGGLGEVPELTREELHALMAGRPADAPYTPEEQDQLADLAEIDLDEEWTLADESVPF